MATMLQCYNITSQFKKSNLKSNFNPECLESIDKVSGLKEFVSNIWTYGALCKSGVLNTVVIITMLPKT